MNNRLYAVITGDIVGSRRFPPHVRETIYNNLESLSERIQDQFAESVAYRPSIFSGDSWQILVKKPERSLRIALYFRAGIIAESVEERVDTRLSIGIGEVDYVPDGNVSGGDGEAYRISGEPLSGKKMPELMMLGFTDRLASDTTDALRVVVKLIDLIVSDWTVPQARAVCGSMSDWTQQHIAENWPGKGISQQAVGQHLDKARWDYINEAVKLFERLTINISKIQVQ